MIYKTIEEEFRPVYTKSPNKPDDQQWPVILEQKGGGGLILDIMNNPTIIISDAIKIDLKVFTEKGSSIFEDHVSVNLFKEVYYNLETKKFINFNPIQKSIDDDFNEDPPKCLGITIEAYEEEGTTRDSINLGLRMIIRNMFFIYQGFFPTDLKTMQFMCIFNEKICYGFEIEKLPYKSNTRRSSSKWEMKQEIMNEKAELEWFLRPGMVETVIKIPISNDGEYRNLIKEDYLSQTMISPSINNSYLKTIVSSSQSFSIIKDIRPSNDEINVLISSIGGNGFSKYELSYQKDELFIQENSGELKSDVKQYIRWKDLSKVGLREDYDITITNIYFEIISLLTCPNSFEITTRTSETNGKKNNQLIFNLLGNYDRFSDTVFKIERFPNVLMNTILKNLDYNFKFDYSYQGITQISPLPFTLSVDYERLDNNNNLDDNLKILKLDLGLNPNNLEENYLLIDSFKKELSLIVNLFKIEKTYPLQFGISGASISKCNYDSFDISKIITPQTNMKLEYPLKSVIIQNPSTEIILTGVDFFAFGNENLLLEDNFYMRGTFNSKPDGPYGEKTWNTTIHYKIKNNQGKVISEISGEKIHEMCFKTLLNFNNTLCLIKSLGRNINEGYLPSWLKRSLDTRLETQFYNKLMEPFDRMVTGWLPDSLKEKLEKKIKEKNKPPIQMSTLSMITKMGEGIWSIDKSLENPNDRFMLKKIYNHEECDLALSGLSTSSDLFFDSISDEGSFTFDSDGFNIEGRDINFFRSTIDIRDKLKIIIWTDITKFFGNIVFRSPKMQEVLEKETIFDPKTLKETIKSDYKSSSESFDIELFLPSWWKKDEILKIRRTPQGLEYRCLYGNAKFDIDGEFKDRGVDVSGSGEITNLKGWFDDDTVSLFPIDMVWDIDVDLAWYYDVLAFLIGFAAGCLIDIYVFGTAVADAIFDGIVLSSSWEAGTGPSATGIAEWLFNDFYNKGSAQVFQNISGMEIILINKYSRL